MDKLGDLYLREELFNAAQNCYDKYPNYIFEIFIYLQIFGAQENDFGRRESPSRMYDDPECPSIVEERGI